jgi:hypothetical protein
VEISATYVYEWVKMAFHNPTGVSIFIVLDLELVYGLQNIAPGIKRLLAFLA